MPTSSSRPWPDGCSSLPGYQQFRRQLETVIASKDGNALQALFHPQGAMRVNGIGGNAKAPDWGFGRPEAQSIWPELEQILSLGCVRRGERLILPAMAGLAEDGSVDSDQLMALAEVAVRKRPDPAAPVVRLAGRGDLFLSVIHDHPPGWTQLLINGKEAYAPTASLRSPHSFQLVLVPFEGRWRIVEFAGGT